MDALMPELVNQLTQVALLLLIVLGSWLLKLVNVYVAKGNAKLEAELLEHTNAQFAQILMDYVMAAEEKFRGKGEKLGLEKLAWVRQKVADKGYEVTDDQINTAVAAFRLLQSAE